MTGRGRDPDSLDKSFKGSSHNQNSETNNPLVYQWLILWIPVDLSKQKMNLLWLNKTVKDHLQPMEKIAEEICTIQIHSYLKVPNKYQILYIHLVSNNFQQETNASLGKSSQFRKRK